MGKLLNEKTGHSQFIGGIVWGIGLALHEDGYRRTRTAPKCDMKGKTIYFSICKKVDFAFDCQIYAAKLDAFPK